MDPILVILFVVAALVVGAVLGWLANGRSLAPLREERDRARAEAEKAETLGRETAEGLRALLNDANSELATLKADARNHDKQLAQLLEAKEALAAQFSEVGSKLLGEAREEFLKRANERFTESEKLSGERLKALLQPVDERLKKYEEQVGKVEKDRTEAYGTLTGLIEQMRTGQEGVRSETARLVNSLRNAPKARGRWGEQQLKNVLETCGLSEHTDFHTEVSQNTEEGRLRPDATITVPGGQSLVIDAKVSLNDYQDAFNADDEEGRAAALARHYESMKTHVDGLSRKAYWDELKGAPDYVIMFVPGEHFLTAALEHDGGLWDYAFEKRILLATPTNLIAIARTVAAVWQQEGLVREAAEIGKTGKQIYDRMAKVAEDLGNIGTHLSRAVKAYNSGMASFNTRLVPAGRTLAELHVETGKRELEEVKQVETLAVKPETESLPKPENDADDQAAE